MSGVTDKIEGGSSVAKIVAFVGSVFFIALCWLMVGLGRTELLCK
jgi:hypothetical protein